MTDLSFEEPQPSTDRNERKFKKRFQGSYLCLSDSSILTIGKDRIIQKWLIEGKVSKEELNTTEGIVLKQGHYFDEEGNQLDIEFKKDSAFINQNFDLRLFKISEDQILRYFRGIHFLNYREGNEAWTVKTLTLEKDGILTIKRIYGGTDEIQKVKEMTDVEEILDEEGKKWITKFDQQGKS